MSDLFSDATYFDCPLCGFEEGFHYEGYDETATEQQCMHCGVGASLTIGEALDPDDESYDEHASVWDHVWVNCYMEWEHAGQPSCDGETCTLERLHRETTFACERALPANPRSGSPCAWQCPRAAAWLYHNKRGLFSSLYPDVAIDTPAFARLITARKPTEAQET